MKFERRALVLHPIGVVFRIASGRCAEKSMSLSVMHGFLVSIRFYFGGSQVAQLLDVVTERHHRQPKVGLRLPDRRNQLAPIRAIAADKCTIRARTLVIR
jgi:hypothetical protein